MSDVSRPRELASSPQEIRRFYDEVYYRSAPAARVSRHLRQLAAKLRIRTGQTALDVACGTGAWVQTLLQRGARVAGLDLSSRALDHARERAPLARFSLGTAESLPFGDEQFDLVSCLGSLEHFSDVQSALREMYRVARPDAAILLLVPNAGFLLRRLHLYGGTEQVLVREEVRGLAEWQDLFESTGFRVHRRWGDTHVLSWSWIGLRGWIQVPLRAAVAAVLAVLPVDWQYQVYHLCQKEPRLQSGARPVAGEVGLQ